MADRNVSVVVRQAHEGIVKAKRQYEVAFDKLLKRMATKMTSFAGDTAGLADTNRQLMSKVSELQDSFTQKSQEVDELMGKIEELRSSASAADSEMQSKIEELGSRLGEMKKQLDAKAAEAEELTGQLSSTKASAGAAVEDYAGIVDELTSAHEDLVGKYNTLADEFEKLAQLSQGATKVDLSAPEVAHTTHNGEFDLVEHLKVALQKNSTKKIWGDW